jgi:two-component system cell cycle response regulator DivK
MRQNGARAVARTTARYSLKRRAARQTPRPPRARQVRPLILVVDDDADQRDLYSRYLTWRGFRVEAAADGQQALNLVQMSVPDLIVMDLSLPHLDGWETTRRLKQDTLTRHIPILACTGHVLGASLERALDAGCDGWAVKPCLPEDLLVEIRRLISSAATSPGALGRRRQG